MRRSSGYGRIVAAGGDTAAPINLEKRLRMVERHVRVRGRRVLDCGCGAGEYVLALLARGADAWGIEFLPEKLARTRTALSGRVSVGDLCAMAVGDSTIDVALLNEVLEHVPDDAAALGEVHRVLKPGGTLVLFSPNRRYPFETHGAVLRGSGRRVPHYVPLIPYVPLVLSSAVLEFWARNYWPGELRRLVTESGFTVAHTDYVWQTFEGISGRAPHLISAFSDALRSASSALEKLPLVRSMGVSQVIVARKMR
jgi:ubiquinone/menaquinone biosynthesis C-methylase UbiE